ncbi:response regulator transcription factor [Planosporangium flavigriseum]|uniref:DNA-binding response regulator n=1 Tax=Planosporangium flavigriseum TaxID=373681 RepID=A0A8J3LX41_9ACTN|nr:response regulator transcription factor [Planosporangium flavigriseum]NJC64819.1 response regulator transcription factor [Planosporangium flavigriseum]GIG72690.1 DNA-binding response regulator [Planosporangium flavigriseum]
MRTVLVCVKTPLAAQAIGASATRLGIGSAVRTALTATEAVSQLAAEPAELVLVDTAVARPDSADFTRRALLASPGATIVFFGVEEPRNAAAAIAAGARGVIRADHTDAVTLVTKAVLLLLTQPAVGQRPMAVNGTGAGDRASVTSGGPGYATASGVGRAVAAGSSMRSGTSVALPHQRADVATEPPRRRVELTERELQVLRGMADGKSNAEIGRDLYVSEDTVKTHARRLFRKLGARDRAHAVASAFRAGLVS